MRELKPIDFSQGKKGKDNFRLHDILNQQSEKSDVQNDVFEIIKIIQENKGKVVLDHCGKKISKFQF